MAVENVSVAVRLTVAVGWEQDWVLVGVGLGGVSEPEPEDEGDAVWVEPR